MLSTVLIILSLMYTSNVAHSSVYRDMPEEDPCAPCEVNFSTRMQGVVCDMHLILADSYMACRVICEDLLGVEEEKTPHKKAEAIENCKCWCQKLMLKDICSEDSCNSPFKDIQCSNISSNFDSTSALDVTRCFERVFEDAQAFNKCANDLNKQTSLPQSVLESPDKGLEGGVEQCVCDCKYVEKQSPIETPTDNSVITVTNDSCSMIFNCMLNTKTRIEIETGINDNGTSFQDCKQKCRVVLDKTRMRTKSRESTSTTSTKESQTRTYARSRTRTRTENYRTGRTIRTRTKIKSITRSRRSITSEDPGTCDCYCSMFHDPCLTPITEPPAIIANVSDDPCSHNFDCTLSFKTKSKISSTMENNGNSFADCQSRCVSESDHTPKSKIHVKHCDCYCAMYHDPCSEAPSTYTTTASSESKTDQIPCTCNKLPNITNDRES